MGACQRVRACVFALRNLIITIIIIDDGLDFFFTARILNRKYLNDDDDEEEEEGKRSKHTYTGESHHLPFFKQHHRERENEGERETSDENAHNLHKALSNREKRRRKKWIFRQKSSRVGKRGEEKTYV